MGVSGNTETEEDRARYRRAEAFFAPLVSTFEAFVEECNVQSEPFPYAQPQWDFRFRTPENHIGYIAMWESSSGFMLTANRLNWSNIGTTRGALRLGSIEYSDSAPETVMRALKDRVRAILVGEGEFVADRFGNNLKSDAESIERWRKVVLRLPLVRMGQE